MIYSEKIPENERGKFLTRINEISKSLGVMPEWLMIVFNFETAGQVSSKTTNTSGCVGLIQFCFDKNGKKEIGKTVYTREQVKAMNNVQQLDIVHDYLYPYRNKILNLYDLYKAVFYPYSLDKNDSYKYGSHINENQVQLIARQNPAISKGKSYITNIEIRNVMNDELKKARGVSAELSGTQKITKITKRNFVAIILIGAGLSAISLSVSYLLQSNKKR